MCPTLAELFALADMPIHTYDVSCMCISKMSTEKIGMGFLVTFCLLLTLAALYKYKRHLPLPLARLISQLLFYPSVPFISLARWWRGQPWFGKVSDSICPAPFSSHPQSFHDMGNRGVVNLCDEYQGPVRGYEKLGIRQLWIPTVDHMEPAIKDLHQAMAFIRNITSAGGSVYIHWSLLPTPFMFAFVHSFMQLYPTYPAPLP